VGLPAVLPAAGETPLLLQGLPAGILAVAHRARLAHQVSLMAVCPVALVQKAPAAWRSSR